MGEWSEAKDAEEKIPKSLLFRIFVFVLMLLHHLLPDNRADCAADDQPDNDLLDKTFLRLFAATTEQEPHDNAV